MGQLIGEAAMNANGISSMDDEDVKMDGGSDAGDSMVHCGQGLRG